MKWREARLEHRFGVDSAARPACRCAMQHVVKFHHILMQLKFCCPLKKVFADHE